MGDMVKSQAQALPDGTHIFVAQDGQMKASSGVFKADESYAVNNPTHCAYMYQNKACFMPGPDGKSFAVLWGDLKGYKTASRRGLGDDLKGLAEAALGGAVKGAVGGLLSGGPGGLVAGAISGAESGAVQAGGSFLTSLVQDL